MKSFLLLGVISTLADLLTYTLLLSFNFHYTLAIIIGYFIGFIVNFYGGRRFVFTEGSKFESVTKEYLMVKLIVVAGLLFNLTIVYMLFEVLHILDQFWARIVAIGTVFVWNLIARKLWVYN
jgi:putative flippase GtrA